MFAASITPHESSLARDGAAIAATGTRPPRPGSVARASTELDSAMQRYAAGELAAFSELYEALAPRLHRFCVRLARQRHEADDLFQEALLRLHRARASYIPGAPVLSWSFAIARSAHLDRARRRRRRPEDPLDAGDAHVALASRDGSPESSASARALLRIVDRAIEQMSEKNRRAYVLLREEGVSVADAATRLGATGDVVKQRAHRADEHVRAVLRDAGWDG